jgi:hypothetical protein
MALRSVLAMEYTNIPAYRVAARLLMVELETADEGEDGEPRLKRARLESVVPAPALPPSKQVAHQPPAAPKPVAPPLWLCGQLPPAYGGGSRGRGRGGNNNW